jgi:hypothetical protein
MGVCQAAFIDGISHVTCLLTVRHYPFSFFNIGTVMAERRPLVLSNYSWIYGVRGVMNKAAGECKPQRRLARVDLAPPRNHRPDKDPARLRAFGPQPQPKKDGIVWILYDGLWTKTKGIAFGEAV